NDDGGADDRSAVERDVADGGAVDRVMNDACAVNNNRPANIASRAAPEDFLDDVLSEDARKGNLPAPAVFDALSDIDKLDAPGARQCADRGDDRPINAVEARAFALLAVGVGDDVSNDPAVGP